MLTLALALALAQTPQHWLFMQPNLPRASYAFFEFAPTDGAGMPAVCSSTAPTGAKGEVLTFTRATTATCTKTASGGLATTGIADGDLVSVASGVARVEYDSNGVKGLLVEEARTNVNVRSEEIDNAAYADTTAGGAAAPTLNGTCGTSPLAAAGSAPEDYTFPATTATQLSIRRATAAVGCSGAACTYSFYVKGVSGSGTMDVCAWDTSTPVCAACAFVDTSWTRCTLTSTRSGVVGLGIGNGSLYNGGTARSSNRVCVTGAQVEAGAYVTSYIPTTNAAVARNAETVKVNGSAFPTVSYSKAISVTVEWATATAPTAPALLVGEVGVASGSDLFMVGAAVRNQNCSGSCTSITSGSQTVVAGTTYRIAADSSGGQSSIYWNGSSILGPSALAAAASPWSTTTGIADNTAALNHLSGIVSRICIDPSPTRCR